MPRKTDPVWRPSASLEVLGHRARLLAAIRRFFQDRGVLEVETPVLSAAANPDPQVESLVTRLHLPGKAEAASFYLQTSPELAMKRLLAAGSGPIYQLARVFRADECGRQHNPEFTMLEWYRPGFDHHQLMAEVEALLREVVGAPPCQYHSYADLFSRYAGIDNIHDANAETLRKTAVKLGIHYSSSDDEIDVWRQLILTHVVEPRLPKEVPLFVHGFPVSQAALARVAGEPPVAERFELYWRGMELANGFHELTDAQEQRRRFEADNGRRRERGLPERPLDEAFLAALEAGMPQSSGVALGVDRLLMAWLGLDEIASSMAFSLENA